MPVLIPITLVCDYNAYGTPRCSNTVQTTAPLKAKKGVSKSYVDLSYSKEPPEWVIKLEDTSSGYGTRYDPEMKCYCPEHAKNPHAPPPEEPKKVRKEPLT